MSGSILREWGTLLLVSAMANCMCSCSRDSGTLYSPSFNEESFRSIEEGMLSNEVVNLIGMPLRVDHYTVAERWLYYSSITNSTTEETGALIRSGSLPRIVHTISFDSQGIVVSQLDVSENIEGQDRSFILQRFGKPSVVESNMPATILNYTLGKYSGSHEVRAVLLDGKGKVSGIKAFYYRD